MSESNEQLELPLDDEWENWADSFELADPDAQRDKKTSPPPMIVDNGSVRRIQAAVRTKRAPRP